MSKNSQSTVRARRAPEVSFQIAAADQARMKALGVLIGGVDFTNSSSIEEVIVTIKPKRA